MIGTVLSSILSPFSHRSRYGFNGKELDPEGLGGGGSTYDYGFRIYNAQLGKFLSIDPLSKSFPFYTPYQFAGNKPIWAIDLDGLEQYYTSSGELIGKYGESTEIRIVYDSYVGAAKYITDPNNINAPAIDVMSDKLYNEGSAGAFSSLEDAAADWGSRNNQKSIDANKEFASAIFTTSVDGKPVVSYTEPVEGSEASGSTAFTSSSKSRLVGHVHSHGAFSIEYKNNVFSSPEMYSDPIKAQESDVANYERVKIRGFVTTPNGSLQMYTPYIGKTDVLRCDMPNDINDPQSVPGTSTLDKSLPQLPSQDINTNVTDNNGRAVVPSESSMNNNGNG